MAVIKKGGGPGTELTKLIPRWAVQFEGKCDCRSVASKMDKWGPEGCRRNEDYLVNHLSKQSDLLIPPLRKVPAKMRRAVAKRLLRIAIRRSERRVSKAKANTEL